MNHNNELKDKNSTVPQTEHRFNALNIEEITLLITLSLAMSGIGISDFSPLKSYVYWSAMTLILAIASSTLGWYQAKQ